MFRVLAIALLAIGPLHATAGGTDMRCDQLLVRRGDLTFEVEERCGPPVRVHSRVELMYPYRPVQVDEWVYEFGTNRFRRLLRFEDGRLRRIELLRKPERSLEPAGF